MFRKCPVSVLTGKYYIWLQIYNKVLDNQRKGKKIKIKVKIKIIKVSETNRNNIKWV